MSTHDVQVFKVGNDLTIWIDSLIAINKLLIILFDLISDNFSNDFDIWICNR